MNKILTVVIPTYNMEKYLRRCLDSLLIDNKEIFDSLEVLVINDGSKDSSSAIAHEYQDKYPNVFRVIDKENGNYGSCVNRGLKEASGKYIKILDADDWFDTLPFSSYLQTLQTLDVDMVINDYKVVNENNKVIKNWSLGLNHMEKIELDNVCIDSIISIQMHALAYKKEILLNMGYQQSEGISYTDQEWCFFPMSAVRTIYYINLTVYCYLLGREGQTMQLSKMQASVFCLELILERMLRYMSNTSLWVIDYQKKRLLSIINLVYTLRLMSYPHIVEKDLQRLDEMIRLRSEDIYVDMETLHLHETYCKIRYIKMWRNGERFLLWLFMKYYLFVSSLLKLLRKYK